MRILNWRNQTQSLAVTLRPPVVCQPRSEPQSSPRPHNQLNSETGSLSRSPVTLSLSSVIMTLTQCKQGELDVTCKIKHRHWNMLNVTGLMFLLLTCLMQYLIHIHFERAKRSLHSLNYNTATQWWWVKEHVMSLTGHRSWSESHRCCNDTMSCISHRWPFSHLICIIILTIQGNHKSMGGKAKHWLWLHCSTYLYLVVDVILSWFSKNLWKVSLDSLYLILASSFSSFSVWTL